MHISKSARTLAAFAMLFAVAFSAYAESEFGNPEEPALRPYKGFWRGVKAFTYNVVKSVDRGNRKFPGLGVVELGRGVRYGTVELLSSTYMGMMGARPKPVTYYSRPNEIIDSDWLLRNAADTAGGAIFWGHWNAETNIKAGLGTFTAQKVVDHSPVLSQRERDLYLEEKPQYTAQRRYIGERAPREREDGRVDFIKRARRQHVITTVPVVMPPVAPPPPPAAVEAPIVSVPSTAVPLPPPAVTPGTPAPVLQPVTPPDDTATPKQ